MITRPLTFSPLDESFAGISITAKLDHLVKEFKNMASPKSTPGVLQEDATTSLQRNFMLAASALQTVKDEMSKKDELAHQKFIDMVFKVDDLETTVKAIQDERKKLVQELKHSEKERVKAIERARATEEKMKKLVEQGEKDRIQVAQEQKKAQQMQKKCEELIRRQKVAQDESDGEKKKGKDSSNTDIAGLQRGLEKTKGQLKKKQDEFQVQAVSLQQATSKIKNMEVKMAEDQKTVDQLRGEIERLENRNQEDQAQLNSERLGISIELARATRQFIMEHELYEAELKSEIAALTRASKQNAEKYKKMEEKTNRLQSQLAELQDAVDYDPYGDADIADRIRIRNLVDQTQERLATIIGLTPAPGESLSLSWRLALGPSSDDQTRILRAKELLSEKDDSAFAEPDRAFIANEDALRHACQNYSRFRQPGNDLHRALTRDGYMTSVQRYLRFTPSEVAGDSLVAMVNYVCPPLFGSV